MAGQFVRFVRRSIYNRWFYAFLAFVCLLNVVAEVLDVSRPDRNLALDLIDLISLVASSVAALLTGAVFLDLFLRRTKQ